MDIAKYIDYTLLKATATPANIEKLCKEALEYGFTLYVSIVAMYPWQQNS